MDVENLANEATVNVIKSTSEHVLSLLRAKDSALRRVNALRKDEIFVEPKEVTINSKWKTKVHTDSDLPTHKMIPSTAQYVPISQTLNALFLREEFKSMYKKYNLEQKHKCEKNVYKDFCCGTVYESNDIFRDKSVVQIQLGIDDFELCCPVESKATKHKQCGIYFQIRNLPPEISSKIDNIFLVALINSHDLKDDAKLNEVVEMIVDDLLKLESNGFNVTATEQLKAALINISCDNLGANVLFGFPKGFNAEYYCRFCELTHAECEKSTREIATRIRTKTSHREKLDYLKEWPDSDLKQMKGVRNECAFNDLRSYDMFENVSLDVMHDWHEGILLVFMSEFFKYCINKKIDSEQNIVRRVRDFNYGPLFISKKPSLLNLKRHNLGQSASQSYYLMVHLPFIFHDKKEQLGQPWKLHSSVCKSLCHAP